MKRRNFIKWSIALPAIAGTVASCNGRKKIPGTIIGANAKTGHIIRDGIDAQPSQTMHKKVVVVGAGISGLSAVRALAAKGITDMILLELETVTGGHSRHGENEISAYPWGAHYIPIPNNTLPEYLSFLEEAGVITGYHENGLPVYNEAHLCFDPQERLYINGRWQDGLVPKYGLTQSELEQVKKFLAAMDQFRAATGNDGKEAFAIPIDRSSRDETFVALDTITMQDWMAQNGYTSEYLHRYVNYCSRDDFGTPHNLVSAWAGIHYYASRKGKAFNADHSDVLTWPAGNGFLVNHLEKNISPYIQTNTLVTQVIPGENEVLIDYWNVGDESLTRIHAESVILATPQYVTARILRDENRKALVTKHLAYAPWMVANLKVKTLEERYGAVASWDNVIHESKSLGYVEASHELLQQDRSRRNLTYYYPLTEQNVTEERKAARDRTHEQWVDLVMNDLQKIHPNIREATEEVNIMVWGHAMAQPVPGLIFGPVRDQLAASQNRVHFAHTDLAGVSIFEEAFYQGLKAANKIIEQFSV